MKIQRDIQYFGFVAFGRLRPTLQQETGPERDLCFAGTGPGDISSLAENDGGDLRFRGHDGDPVAIYRAVDGRAGGPGFWNPPHGDAL